MLSRIVFRSALLSLFGFSFFFAGARPATADLSHARIVRLSLVQGDVRFTRDAHHDPLADQKAVWEAGVLNLPIRQGYVLATDSGRAEVEFENGAMAFLAPNTVLEFYDLSLEDGAKTTRLVVRQGTATFYVNPGRDDYFSVTGGDFTVEAGEHSTFRLNNFDDGSAVDVTRGHVSVLHNDKTTALAKGQSLSMRANDKNSVSVASLPENDDFDRWVNGRVDSVVTATTAAQQYVNSPYYSSGFADLYTYGSFYSMPGYGNCWRPYGVGLGWSPFDSGGWFMDPGFGMSFIGYQPWGWTPYHYGSWFFDSSFGWMWAPTGFGAGFGAGGFVPWQAVTGRWVRSGTGLLGIVPVHPMDARGKAPINMTRGIFEVKNGAVSQLMAVNSGDRWKAIKNVPRNALTSNAVVASAAPARMSRTMIGTGASSHMVNMGRNSSIAFDSREHRFVSANSPVARTEMQRTANQNAMANNARDAQMANRTATVANRSEMARVPGSPGAARTGFSPSMRTHSMTPPPSPRSAGMGGTGRSGASMGGGGSMWGGGSAAPSSRGMSSTSSAPSARASAPSGGRPH